MYTRQNQPIRFALTFDRDTFKAITRQVEQFSLPIREHCLLGYDNPLHPNKVAASHAAQINGAPSSSDEIGFIESQARSIDLAIDSALGLK